MNLMISARKIAQTHGLSLDMPSQIVHNMLAATDRDSKVTIALEMVIGI